jgi:4-amino-4-deoxy-L-arabinose transferase-like glycosyltransferase
MAQLIPSLKPHWRLAPIVALYLLLAVTHSLIVPLTTGNDEWAHFLYVRFITEHGRLPQTPAERAEAGYKADAPPLYHLLVAGLSAGIEPTRLLRPLDPDLPRRYLADNVTPSYALVHTAVEQMPFRGEVLVWYVGRWLAIAFGLGLIVVTYATALFVFPAQHRRAALAAALVAFIPAVIFHSSVLSYESLSALLTALFLLAALQAIRRPNVWRWWVALGLLAGLSIVAKYSALLLPLEIIFVAGLALAAKPRPAPSIIARLLVAGLVLAVVVGLWFGYVLRYFNTVESQGPVMGLLQPLLIGDASDTTSVQVAGFLFGRHTVAEQARPPLPRNYPHLAQSFLDSFWAAPIAGRFFLSPGLTWLFTGLAVVGLAGLWPLWAASTPATRRALLLLIFHAVLILPLLVVRVLFSFDPQEVAQGRHILLPAASAIAILLIWGWAHWSPKLAGLAVAGLLAWCAIGQVGTAWAAYSPPLPVWPHLAPSTGDELLPGQLALLDASPHVTGAALAVTLHWAALAAMPEDYLVGLTLTDAAGQVSGHALGHPAAGRYPTRAWEPGDVVEDRYRLPLSGPISGEASLQLRLLTRSGEPVPDTVRNLGPVALPPLPAIAAAIDSPSARPLRPNQSFTVISRQLPTLTFADGTQQSPFQSAGPFHTFVVGPDWPASGAISVDSTTLGALAFDIPPRNFAPPDIPSPLPANFNNQLELLGYHLPTRRIEPGGRLPLTLYWRGLAYMGEDYRIFANPLDETQQRRGGYDRRPQDGYSTLRWVPGEVVPDPFGIPIDPAAPAGIYTIDFGLYRETGRGAESLPLMQDGQPLPQHSIRLGPIKVGGPPPDVLAQNPSPQHPLNRPFGAEITLVGYDVTPQPDQSAVTFTFYWRVNAVPAADYTTFVHLRPAAGETVAQRDAPPVGGRYPTSLWDPGEIIIDQLTLPLTDVPPGNYTPVIGLYDFTTGQRLPIPNHPANELPLDPLAVTTNP